MVQLRAVFITNGSFIPSKPPKLSWAIVLTPRRLAEMEGSWPLLRFDGCEEDYKNRRGRKKWLGIYPSQAIRCTLGQQDGPLEVVGDALEQGTGLLRI